MQIGALIPIRLGSERLPGKALKLIRGRPIVHHLLDRVAACKNIPSLNNIVVCTTPEKTDDPLVHSVKDYGASIFRGEKNDLIRRFKNAVDAFNFDLILQVDGDDPLADVQYMDLTIEALLDNPKLDAAVSFGLPFGINVKSFTRIALEKVFSHYKSEINDTGFALYFIKSSLCNCLRIPPLNANHILDEARLTLDYNQDLVVFKKIFGALYKPGEVFGLDELIRFLKENPEIIKINNSLQVSYLDRSREKLDIKYSDDNGRIQNIKL